METRNLTKVYKIKNGEPVFALKNINIMFPECGLVFILGRSGSGKSTLLNMLAGLDKPTEGEVLFHGESLSDFSTNELDCYRNTYCGFVFQEYNVLSELTVGENISLAVEMQGGTCTKEELEGILEQVGLKGYEDRHVDELSGGQKQRIAIARALIKKSEIIFADEPTGALDCETGEAILSLLKKLSKERLVLIVSHDRDFAKKFGDYIIELADGEVVKNSIAPTKQGDVLKNTQIIKPKIPLKTAIRLGFSNLKAHPIRLIITLMLAVIAFTMFCVPLDILLWDEKQAFIEAVYAENVEYSVIWKRRYIEKNNNELDLSLDRFLGAIDDMQYQKVAMSDMEIQKFNNLAQVPAVKVSWGQMYFLQNQILNFKNENLRSEFQSLRQSSSIHYGINLNGFISISNNALAYFDYVITGRLPQNENEVAIPMCLYNTFAFFGFIDSDGEEYDISKPEDIIGKNLNIETNSSKPRYAKIVGVLDMNCENDCVDAHWDQQYEFHEKAFVCDSFLSSLEREMSLIFVTPKDKKDFQAMFEEITKDSGENISYAIYNEVSEIYGIAQGGIVTMLGNLCLYLGVVFFIIAFVFLINYIKTSLRRQLKQIGVLSAMGIDTKGMLKIYGGMTFVICVITFLFSILGTLFVGKMLNRYFSRTVGVFLQVCQFQVLVPIILFFELMVVAVISCLIPILQYKQKSPAEIISAGLVK